MANILNPETLKTLRTSKGWTQADLAAESSCSKEQIGRWERGGATNPRKTSQDRLAKALGVEWEELTRPLEQAMGEDRLTTQLNVRVRPSTRTALEIASVTYGVTWADIVNLAPLLFHIVAQGSLSARRQALGAAKAKMDEAIMSAQQAVPQLVPALSMTYDDSFEAERKSIEGRKVFATYELDDGQEYQPFVAYLNRLMQDLPEKSREAVSIDDSFAAYAPHYSFQPEVVKKAARLTENDEIDEKLVARIQAGSIDLKEFRSRKLRLEKGTLSEREFSEWIAMKMDEVEKAEKSESIEDLF